jgi:integrase
MHLTKLVLKTLTTDDRRGWHVPDDEVQGFGVTVLRDGRKSFFIRYNRGRVRRRVTFGKFPDMTLQEAREEAQKLLAQVRLAKIGQAVDPAVARDRVAACPTWAEWTSTYIKEVTGKKKSFAHDRRFLGLAETGTDAFRALRGKWGSHLLTDITAASVRAFHDSMAGTPTQANRWLASCSACFAEAMRRDLVALNPCARVAHFPEAPPRARVLTVEERIALYASIEREEDPHARGALRLLALTGMRLREVLNSKWDDIDEEGMLWRIPSPKAGKPQSIPLWPAVVDVLKEIPREKGCPFIVVGRSPLKARADLKKPWAAALRRAGLSKAGITTHDLRRDVGKYLADTFGIHVAKTILRHSDIRITESVYAPTSLSEARSAMESRVLPFIKKAAG